MKGVTADMLRETLASRPDLRRYSMNELKALAEEIRQFLLHHVSVTGGHLASNLVVVELTLALHRVFNPRMDRIIWDVGHQSYVHKILTGRLERFPTLRCLDGLSGFPKISEEDSDCFGTGHSSTSISAALGLARARDLKNERHAVIAVIGDGSMTGGMAYEALNDAGSSQTSLIVILNDNRMSISPNVGAMARYLERLRLKPRYFKAKEKIEDRLRTMPGSLRTLLMWGKKVKDAVRHFLVPETIFEDLGFRYYGPLDGHDLGEMLHVLTRIKEIRGPVLVHVCTRKGKGYPHAEQHPEIFHGISPFEVETGEQKQPGERTWTDVFGDALVRLAARDDSIVAVTAAMPQGTGLSRFARAYPDRYFDVGIAEQHAATFCAGLACAGMKPVLPVYSSFLQRAYDQVLHDICIQRLHVVLAVDRAGLVGEDGETHQGIFDLSYLRHIPGMILMAPADYREIELMLDFALYSLEGPVAIRYPRGTGPVSVYGGEPPPLKPGRGVVIREGDGTTVAIIAIGAMVRTALRAAEFLEKQGLSPAVVNARFARPIDETLVKDICRRYRRVYTLEENTTAGGFGSGVLEVLSGKEVTLPTLLGIPDQFPPHGRCDQLHARYRTDAAGVAERILTDMAADETNSADTASTPGGGDAL